VCRKFFQPADWRPSVFFSEKPLESCRGYRKIWPFCGKALIPHIRKAKTVAIDLEVTDDVESDKKSILEFGWKNAAGTGRCKNTKGLNFSELSEAAEECLSGQTAPCIVGHNLLDWDLKILQEHEVAFPESSSLWDTLIASWLLKPWCDSHALVVHVGAHQADADAEACYVLFETQSTQLAPCLAGSRCCFFGSFRKF